MQFYSLITLTIASSMAILSAMAAPAVPKCGTVCPAVYQPICAKAKTGLNKVFGNACELTNYNCKHPNANFVLVADSSCEELPAPTCNTICTDNYQPVCGKLLSGEFKTFGNSCELKHYNCEHSNAQATAVFNNACAVDTVEKRAAVSKCDDIVCAAVEQPVCAKAKSGLTKTFGNYCELKKYNCKHPNAEFVVLAQSTCEDLAAPKCDFMCLMVDDPVCATFKDGTSQTFSNACLLDVYNCQNPSAIFKLVANGACPATPICTDACPAVYQPVCAKLQSGETKTFGNKCELSAFNCKDPKGAFSFVFEGAC